MKTYIYSWFSGVLSGMLFLLSISGQAQDRKVTGKITDTNSQPVPGANILVKGSTIGTTSDADGDYVLTVRDNVQVLVISSIGFKSQEITIGNQTVINAVLAEDASSLDEVIVTGYTSEKKKDIIGSVSIVNTTSLQTQPSANLQNALQGRAAGVTVSGTGAPGAGAKVRIRGFVSFGNNDPLYVIDGVPTYDPQNLNTQDVASIQVLKDPVSASIYGSRAANGVIVVTTKTGTAKKTEISYDGYYGVQSIPESKFPKMLNTQQYADYLWQSFSGAGISDDKKTSKIFGTGARPTIPDFLVGGIGGVAAGDPRANPALYNVSPAALAANPDAPIYQISQTSPGTNWFKEVYQPGPIQQHQLSARGGSEKGVYSVGLNYFNQQGNFLHTGFEKYTARINTQFKPRTWLRVGENFQLAYQKFKGSGQPNRDFNLDFTGEGSPWAQAYRMVPYLPVYDIKGNFAGNSPGESGNGSSPVANAVRNKHNAGNRVNLLGNVFVQADLMKDLTASSSFGIDGSFLNSSAYTTISYERAENQKSNAYFDFFQNELTWTWTNSLAYRHLFARKHDVRLFAATEAIRSNGRFLTASRQNYDFDDPAFRSINTGKSLPQAVGSPLTPTTLYSIFGKAEYTYADKYLFSFTMRRDGSSVFGPQNRYATFPAAGLGWRISEESFMKSIPWISDLKLRGGWGQMGSQRNVPALNAYSFFGANINTTAYDIAGGAGGVAIGYRPDRVGNPATKWETAEMINVGIDGSFWDGRLDFSLEYFNNKTKDLLVDRQRNGLEQTASQPLINVGTMVNRGFDAAISTKGNFGASGLSYDVGITFTSYENKVTKLDAEGSAFFDRSAGRLLSVQRTQAGYALSTFYGYKIAGFFNNVAEVRSAPTQDGIDKTSDAAAVSSIGKWRYKDLNNDGKIDQLDRAFLGNPIPKFQMGTDIILKYKNFDFNAFLFWNYGNSIYNYTKWFTDLRGFVGGVSARVLTDAWTPTNPNPKIPVLNINDTQSTTLSNDYYIESGSYLRLRTLQLGYTLPESLAKRAGLSRVRVYVQGQNLLTITKYQGPDPDISILGDELTMGVDQFRTPAPSIVLAGLGITF